VVVREWIALAVELLLLPHFGQRLTSCNRGYLTGPLHGLWLSVTSMSIVVVA